MTGTQIFNTVSLLHYTEEDRVLSAQLLKMALQDIPDFLYKANECFQKNQFRDAAVWIHKIKGIAGTVGADLLYAICITSEEVFKMTSSEFEAEAILGTLRNRVDEFCHHREVQDWISDV